MRDGSIIPKHNRDHPEMDELSEFIIRSENSGQWKLPCFRILKLKV